MPWIIAGIVLVVILAAVETRKQIRNPRKYTEMRCPTCGAPARNYGTKWECTWCGDFGRIER